MQGISVNVGHFSKGGTAGCIGRCTLNVMTLQIVYVAFEKDQLYSGPEQSGLAAAAQHSGQNRAIC